ncbi:hypothetical protein [Kitasatospora sp. NPDC098663]|uniref:competence protein CoiA family protein n=1 Tax=Kitasatospora sp. NPDC098663 TaxID=3364096 RepID=UPI00382F9A36
MGDETSAPWVYDQVTKRWVDLSLGVAGLEPGEAGGRYRCRACRERLVLRSAKPGAVNSPHFSHKAGADCSASPAVREQLAIDDRVVIEFRQRITRAWPGMTCVLEYPAGLYDDGEQPAVVLPPAVVVPGGLDGQGALVVERPRRPVDVEEVQERIRTVRARYGVGARHVWFWTHDVLHAARLADLPVAPRGQPKTKHATIAPTAQQLAVIASGGRVYFLDGQQVLVPYGVHDITHEHRAGEDWDFRDWRRDWRHDWRISHPVPTSDASRWGLAPVAFQELTRTRGVFTLSAANDLMLALERSQAGRWNHRRSEASKLYRERHQPPLPAAPAPVGGLSPATPASHQTARQAEPTPVPAEHPRAVATPMAAANPVPAASGTDPTSATARPGLEGVRAVDQSVGSDDDYLLAPAAPADSPVRLAHVPPPPAYPPTVHLPGYQPLQVPPGFDRHG